jgi:DNA damage-binding protein 1
MSYNYVVTAHSPTNVTHALAGDFLGTEERSLIVCKCTCLELHRVVDDGLKLIHKCPVYGRVSTMNIIRPAGSNQDYLCFTTEGYQYCIVRWDQVSGQMVTIQSGKVKDRIGRPSECGTLAIVAPNAKIIAIHVYDGLLKIIPVGKTASDRPFNVKLEELSILDMVFLHGMSSPTICLLYTDSRNNSYIKTYTLSLKQKDLEDGPWQSQVNTGTSI